MEVGFGLTRLFPHRKRIHFIKGLSSHFSQLITTLAVDGYDVVEWTLEDLQGMISSTEWEQKLDSKDLFVLYSMDDPLLGRLFPVQALEKIARDKKIFQICISHSWHHYVSREMILQGQNSYKISLYSMDFKCCLAHLGERSQIEALTSSSLNWEEWLHRDIGLEWNHMTQATQVLSPPKVNENKNRELILQFESTIRNNDQDFSIAPRDPNNSNPSNTPRDSSTSSIPHVPNDSNPPEMIAPLHGAPRLFDRAVLCWEDMDGLTLIDCIAKEMNLELAPPGEDKNFETTSLSRWHCEKSMGWLQDMGISPNQARGLVIFSHSIINDRFIDILLWARKAVLHRQLGSPPTTTSSKPNPTLPQN